MAKTKTAPAPVAETTTITVESPEQLNEYLVSLEENTTQAANASGLKMETAVEINGKPIRCTVTPPAKPGRKPYTLFYVEQRRTARTALRTVVMPS